MLDCFGRAEDRAANTQEALQAAQLRVDELAAESRVLQESSKAMRQECNEAWVSHPSFVLSQCTLVVACHLVQTHCDNVQLIVVLHVHSNHQSLCTLYMCCQTINMHKLRTNIVLV